MIVSFWSVISCSYEILADGLVPCFPLDQMLSYRTLSSYEILAKDWNSPLGLDLAPDLAVDPTVSRQSSVSCHWHLSQVENAVELMEEENDEDVEESDR